MTASFEPSGDQFGWKMPSGHAPPPSVSIAAPEPSARAVQIDPFGVA